MSQIHPSAVVDKTAQLGKNVVVGPNSVVGANTVIGDECILDACVVIGNNVKIGTGNQFYANSVIGKSPQTLANKLNTDQGDLIIGDNNVFRENVTIHPGMHPGDKTVIGSENFIMIGVHIGHDIILEDKIVISNYSQISGHCNIQTGVWLSGMVLLHQFVTIGKWAYAAGFSGINHDVPPFVIVSGHYPPTVRAINKRGLTRAGIEDQSKDNIFDAFKKLFRTEGPLLEKAKTLVEETTDSNVKDMCELIIKSSKHRFGRYLESFR